MGILRDAKNWEQHLEESGFEYLKDWMIIA
jgi:hypothetical protein